MIDWNFTPEHSISLTIAADARLCHTHYTNDQIWELNLGNSEPPAVALQTTFGLRARICNIFPRFIHKDKVITDPAHFYRPITIHKYFPNYIKLSFRPFSSINVQIEYWVPGSQVIAGRTKITNLSREIFTAQLEWAELLIPSPEGVRMATREMGLTTILAGQTSNIIPVFLLTGGIQAGKSTYPALNLAYEIPPHGEEEARWVNASLDEINASFELSKQIINKNWEAEFARIQRINSSQLEITTGNHDWNTALYFAQTISRQLIIQPTASPQSASFVYSRNPDQGYSMRADGGDYNHLWNGQTAFDTYYLANLLLPASPDIVKCMLDNFLATQTHTGEIDWKPGVGGQRSQLLATPLIATLTWMYYQYTGDSEYLKLIYPQLTRFYFSWFEASHDRDGDALPEWDQIIQTGFEEHPLFSVVHPRSIGLDISTVESPDLIAYLYRECISLLTIARLLEDDTAAQIFIKDADRLKHALEQFWSDQQACFLYRDRDSHFVSPGGILGTQQGSGILEIHQEFQPPIRPQLCFVSKRERTNPIQVYIHGTTPTGAHRVDHLTAYRIRWHLGTGFLTSDSVYQSIEKIEITGCSDDVNVIVRSPDMTIMDQTQLLPLWAGLLTEENAKILINLTILNKKRFLSPYGLKSILNGAEEDDIPESYYSMHLPLVSLVLEGLVRYGMQKKAAEVFNRMMKAILHALKNDLKFYQSYHSETGVPLGAANTLTSLIPIGLFLKILGVNIINPNRLEVSNGNPFPWPVTIKYCGLTVVHQDKKTAVIFPNGQNVTIENDHPQIISLHEPESKSKPSTLQPAEI